MNDRLWIYKGCVEWERMELSRQQQQKQQQQEQQEQQQNNNDNGSN